jgi:hypothetical protein
MRRHLKSIVFALVAAPLVAATGCDRFQAPTGARPGPGSLLPEKFAKRNADGSSTPGQDAIVRVLEADREQFHVHFDVLDAGAQPSAVSKCIAAYVQHLEKSDATGAPYEFREARTRHAKAWSQLKTILERHPDSYDDVEFLDALIALFHGEKVRGRKLGGDIIDAVTHVTETYVEVFAKAEGYGVAVE